MLINAKSKSSRSLLEGNSKGKRTKKLDINGVTNMIRKTNNARREKTQANTDRYNQTKRKKKAGIFLINDKTKRTSNSAPKGGNHCKRCTLLVLRQVFGISSTNHKVYKEAKTKELLLRWQERSGTWHKN